MSSHMASHIHSHRETRDMCGKLFNIYSQSSGMPTKPLRANILCIHSIQHFLLKKERIHKAKELLHNTDLHF